MKNKLSIIASILFIAFAMTSCKKKFNDLQTDPNRATAVPANLVLNGVLADVTNVSFNITQRWNQFYCCNYAYYGDQQYWSGGVSFAPYSVLNNVNKMETEAAKSLPAVNAYSALGKFLRAYIYYNLTMQVGDVPMTAALQGLNNLTPKYDNQKAIFVQILKWLEESNTDMTTVINNGNYILSGDFYYNNNLASWRKAVNTFKLRVLVQLSRYESDADLNVKQKFSDVINNPSKYPVFTTVADDWTYVYNTSYNKFPTSPDSYGFDAMRYNMSSTYLGNLVSLNDPRTFAVAEPADSIVRTGVSPTSFAAFKGASSGEDLATMSSKAGKGLYSFINRKRYYSTYTAETTCQLGYTELCFNMAEAINRGWISGNAETWYQNGIQANIKFYGFVNGTNSVYFQKVGGTLSDYNVYTITYDWNTYYNQTAVKYAGNNATGLNQILLQKYLAFYQNSGFEAYYNWRRTNVPTFLVGPGTGNSARVPLRYQYPSNERAVNAANVNAAITSQFGTDDINAKMWIIK